MVFQVANFVGTEAELTAVAATIREILRMQGLSRALSIGRLILERFYGSSEAEWRARRAKKNNSIRALAARPDCPLGKSALSEAVGVYLAVRDLPFVHESRYIGAGHVAVLLRLKSAAEREAWLRRAEAERWSVRRLRDMVVQSRKDTGEKRGRPALSSVARARTRVYASLEMARSIFDGIGSFEDREQSEAEALALPLKELLVVVEQALVRCCRAGWIPVAGPASRGPLPVLSQSAAE